VLHRGPIEAPFRPKSELIAKVTWELCQIRQLQHQGVVVPHIIEASGQPIASPRHPCSNEAQEHACRMVGALGACEW